MSNVDELLNNSGFSRKRKLDLDRDPTEIYKSVKLTPNGLSNRQIHVDETDTDHASVAIGPVLALEDDGDAHEDVYGDGEEVGYGNEDVEGRFFGSGITTQEREILEYVDSRDQDKAMTNVEDKIDTAWLRRRALQFEKCIIRNAEQRGRFPDEPARFIESEAELDADVRALTVLADHSDLYPEFARLGCAANLVSLLAHENTDVAIDAIECVSALTDEDVTANESQWGVLTDALLEADLVSLLVGTFARLDEAGSEIDRNGVYYALTVVENLCSRTEIAETLGQHEDLLRWLLQRVQASERPVSQNKQYAAELLAILVQNSAVNRQRLGALDAVDTMLQLVAAYRKRDPEKGGYEEEYMENLFEALACITDEPDGKKKFLEAEGVELCLIMLKEGKLSKPASLRLIDHAAAGWDGAEICQRLVEAGGLKTTFTMFMKKTDRRTTEHLVGIFAWMLRLLPTGSPARIRILAKFVEKNYEKTERLVNLRRDYGARVAVVDIQIEEEQQSLSRTECEDMLDEWFSRRLDAGLFCLQTIDLILAWLIAEDNGIKEQIRSLLADRDETFASLKGTIQEDLDDIDAESEEGKKTREMLAMLASFLE